MHSLRDKIPRFSLSLCRNTTLPLRPHSKSEARIARKNERALQAKEKSARLVSNYVADELSREVRAGANPDTVFNMYAVISYENPDVEGSWSWGVQRQWCEQEWATDISPKLEQWSKLKWSEIDSHSSDTGHKMHHNMSCEDICEEAQDRMIKIERFYEVLFRFRTSNLGRVWGYRVVNKFHVLWYDPTHQIYPTGV